MNIDVIESDFDKQIVEKKDFFADLIEYTDIDQSLIRKAINHMSSPPDESFLYYFDTPKIEKLKKDNPDEYKKVIGVRKALSVLLNSSVINQREKDTLKSIQDRIIHEYDLDLVDKKALLDRSRDENDVTSIEDYRHYNDAFGMNIIDKRLKTNQQCEGKLITMLEEYLMPLAERVNTMKSIGHQRDYKRKDVFELIAEILNLCWLGKYNYQKIRIIFRNYQTIKP
jgi:hypothetical protein